MFERALVCTLLLSVAACATPPAQIEPAYVSTALYAHLTCDQLRAERRSAYDTASAIRDRMQSRVNTDQTLVSVGLFVAWPALLFTRGEHPQAEAYAHALGVGRATSRLMAERACGSSEEVPPPAATAPSDGTI